MHTYGCLRDQTVCSPRLKMLSGSLLGHRLPGFGLHTAPQTSAKWYTKQILSWSYQRVKHKTVARNKTFSSWPFKIPKFCVSCSWVGVDALRRSEERLSPSVPSANEAGIVGQSLCSSTWLAFFVCLLYLILLFLWHLSYFSHCLWLPLASYTMSYWWHWLKIVESLREKAFLHFLKTPK